MDLADDIAAALAAHRHIGYLWTYRHHPLARRWIRGYFLRIRLLQDQIEGIARSFRRYDDDTTAVVTCVTHCNASGVYEDGKAGSGGVLSCQTPTSTPGKGTP